MLHGELSWESILQIVGAASLSCLSPPANWSIPAGRGMAQPVSSVYGKLVNEVYQGAVAGSLTPFCANAHPHMFISFVFRHVLPNRTHCCSVLSPLVVAFALLIQKYGQSFSVCSKIELFLGFCMCLTEGIPFQQRQKQCWWALPSLTLPPIPSTPSQWRKANCVLFSVQLVAQVWYSLL